MKKTRQAIIAKVIEENSISTQDELLDILLQQGVQVTQATVSRDIKEMHIIKRPNAAGEYKYCMPTAPNEQSTSKYMSILLGSVIYTDVAMNTVVLKCHVGTAQAACAAVDSFGYPEIAGTLAGDDTVFLLCYTEEDAHSTKRKLDKLFGF